MIKTPNAGSTYNGGILGRRRRLASVPQDPQKTALSAETALREPAADRRKAARRLADYPERPLPSRAGPARDRWVRELVGSIVDRTAPALLDRADVLLALDLSSGAFDHRIREEKLVLEDMVCVGPRELYRREDVRALILVTP